MCPKGVYAIFTIFGFREGVLGPHPHTKFHCSGFKNVGLHPEKSRKIAIFGIICPWENFRGPQNKLNIGK